MVAVVEMLAGEGWEAGHLPGDQQGVPSQCRNFVANDLTGSEMIL